MTLTRLDLEQNTNLTISEMDQILLDQGMHTVAVEQEQRIIKKNNQINKLISDLNEVHSNSTSILKKLDLVENGVYNLIRKNNEQKFVIGKIIEAKKKTVRESSDLIEMNKGLNYCCEKLEINGKQDKLMISLLRHQLDQRTRPDVVYLHRKDLEDLKESRDKYKHLTKSIATRCVTAMRADQPVTAKIYRDLLPILIE